MKHELKNFKSHNEDGSAIVQLIMVFPFVLILGIVTIQFAVFNYNVASLASQVNRAVIATDIRDYAKRLYQTNSDSIQAEVEAAYAKDILDNMGMGFKEDELDLTISDLTIKKDDRSIKVNAPNGNPSKFKHLNDYDTTLHVQAKIRYKMPQFGSDALSSGIMGIYIPIDWTVERDIDIVQTGSARFEAYE